MSARRYLVCAAVSVAMHSLLAFSADQEPAPFSLKTAPKKSERVSIALMSAPSKATPLEENQNPKETQTPVLKAPEKTEKAAEPPQKQATKPASTKAKAVEKASSQPLSSPIKPAAPLTTKQASEKKPPVLKAPTKKNSEKKEQNNVKKAQKETKVLNKKPTARPQSKDASSVNQKESAPIQVEKPAFKVKPKAPKYPRIAKRKNMEGTVLIEVWLDEKGNQIKHILIKSSSFALLDKAAMTAVKQWHFKGHTENGVPKAHRVRIPVLFKLDAS